MTFLIPQNDAVDASLDGSGAPARGQALGDSVEVLLQALGERRDARQPGLARGGHPLRQVLAGEVCDHGGEGTDLAGYGLQLGAAVQDGLEPGLLVLGQGVRAAAEPVGDVPDGRRRLAERCFLRADLVEVVADDGVAAVVAEGFDLVEQAGEAAVSFAGVLVEVGLERVELAGPRGLPAAVGQFLPRGGSVVALDGVQAPAQVAADLPQPASLGPQGADLLVLAARGIGELPRRVRRPGVCRPCGLRLGVVGSQGGRLGQAGAVGGDALLDGLGQVLPQVEPVGDLHRPGRTGPGPVRIRA